jgi:hypothetical protein
MSGSYGSLCPASLKAIVDRGSPLPGGVFARSRALIGTLIMIKVSPHSSSQLASVK